MPISGRVPNSRSSRLGGFTRTSVSPLGSLLTSVTFSTFSETSFTWATGSLMSSSFHCSSRVICGTRSIHSFAGSARL